MDEQQNDRREIIYEKTIGLDFDALDEWRDAANDDLPIYGITSFYRACGVNKMMEEYLSGHREDGESGPKYAPVEVLFCNFYTHRRIKNLIEDHWRAFSLKPNDDGGIVWDTKKYSKGERHYRKNLSKSAAKSIGLDFLAYCPTVDDDLEDNLIVFRIMAEKPAAEDTADAAAAA